MAQSLMDPFGILAATVSLQHAVFKASMAAATYPKSKTESTKPVESSDTRVSATSPKTIVVSPGAFLVENLTINVVGVDATSALTGLSDFWMKQMRHTEK